jgi:uncharacterized RDD family membrane protein YckC
MNEFNPYQPPAAPVIDSEVSTLVLADRGTRLGAKILDGFILLGSVGVASAIMIPQLLRIRQAERAGLPHSPVAPFVAIAAVLMIGCLCLWVWNVILLHRYGQTIGKRILKIKIVRVDGSRVSLWRIIGLRWLPTTVLSAIPIIGYVFRFLDPLLIFRNSRQCLHDQIADTIVVKSINYSLQH